MRNKPRISIWSLLSKYGLGLISGILQLSANEKIRLTLQKWRLLGLANWIYGKFAHAVARLPQIDAPIYFLGERLFAEREWISRMADGEGTYEVKANAVSKSSWKTPICAVLVSLYKSDSYLDSFLENIQSQTIIDKCEVVIISVLPSEFEKITLEIFAEKNKYVNLIITDVRIGIYEAWNRAITYSSAKYITNMNADDVRHPLSLEIQVSELEQNELIDVVYQDVYYTLRQNLAFDTIARVGMKSNLPQVSTQILARGINAPHNAPMWRRSLHDRIGLFDETFLSAGDHDFWIRASIEGATFKKSAEVHVSYFINPEGMSTKKNSPGASEGLRILDKYRQYAQG